jgi:hypothetical protein
MRQPTAIFIAVLILTTAATGGAAVPDVITYSGRLTDGTAWGQSTTVALTFRVYGSADGDDLLWQAEFADVVIEDGYFSVMLSDGKDAAGDGLAVASVFAVNDEAWMTVCVGEGCQLVDDLAPRRQIGSVPYAVRAGRTRHAETVAQSRRVSATAIYRTSTVDKEAVVGKGSFDGTGRTKGHIRFPESDGSGEAEGYRAGKLACEAALTSPTAHMCTDHEMVLSMQMAHGNAYVVWVARANTDIYTSQDGNKAMVRDCWGWMQEVSELDGTYQHGGTWNGTYPNHHYCGTPQPVACCDFPAE